MVSAKAKFNGELSMSPRPRAFEGLAFDDDAFDCEFFEQVIGAFQNWIPGAAQGTFWIQAPIQPETWIASDNDDGL